MKTIQKGIVGVLVGLAYVLPVQAGFEVMESPSAPGYGNGRTGSFDRAIRGGGPLTPQEQADFAKIVPESDYDRYYGRVKINFSTLILDQIKNTSSDSNAGASVVKKRGTFNQLGMEIAVGHTLEKNVRGELEYLINKNLTYEANPVLSGAGIVSRQLNAQVKNNTILANFYYDFDGVHRLRPYLTGGIGLAMNSVQSDLTPATTDGGSDTKRSLKLAWGLGAGMRLAMASRWYIDLGYRYINLGAKTAIEPNSSFELQGNYTMNAISVGLIYLF